MELIEQLTPTFVNANGRVCFLTLNFTGHLRMLFALLFIRISTRSDRVYFPILIYQTSPFTSYKRLMGVYFPILVII